MYDSNGALPIAIFQSEQILIGLHTLRAYRIDTDPILLHRSVADTRFHMGSGRQPERGNQPIIWPHFAENCM